MNKIILIVIVVLTITTGGYLFFKGSSKEKSEPVVSPGTSSAVPAPGETDVEEVVVEEGKSLDEVKEIIIISTEFAFTPSIITARAGQQIVLNFENQGKSNHNFIIEGLGVGSRVIGAGQTDIIEFTASDSGTYTFFCSVPGHRAAGMEGLLKVE